MGLYERIQAARGEAGANKQETDIVIDLAAHERRLAMTRPASFGSPSLCPECGKPGYLDHIDMVRRRQFQHCPYCEAKWVLTEEELATAE
jgi:hypothetical protein